MKPHKISRELMGAVAEEQKAHAIDAAKKKAVAQHADYDTFKKMVSVAHLKPLHAPGSQGLAGRLVPAWQLDPRQLHGSCGPDARLTATCSSAGAQQPEHPIQAAAPVVPRTSQEFAREWRRQCPTAADKTRLLKQCGPDGLAAIFRVEVDGILLAQMLQALQQQWQQVASATAQAHPHEQQQPQQAEVTHSTPAQSQHQQQRCRAEGVHSEAMLVLRMLQSLTGAGRFDLSVRLLDSTSRAAAAELCSQLQEALQQAPGQQQQQQQQEPGGPSSIPGSVGVRGLGSTSGSTEGDSVTQDRGACSSSGTQQSSASPLADLQAVMLKLRLL